MDTKLLLEEIRRRESRLSVPNTLLQGAFPASIQFLTSRAKQRALKTPRRAGKTNAAARLLCGTSASRHQANCLFIGLTRLSAKKIVWDVLKDDFNRRYDLMGKFNETELTLRFPNGSTISLMGADADKSESEKILGQALDLVIIDESASFTIDLEYLVRTVIRPTLIDRNGRLVMIGTPNGNVSSFFAKVTMGQVQGWELHTWSTLDNPHIAEQMRAEMDELAQTNPLYLETPQYKQHYLGEWVMDLDALVYKYTPERNLFEELPRFERGEWHYILGCDLGIEDDSAIVAAAFHDHDPTLYVMDCFKERGLDITDFANVLKVWRTKYQPEHIVIDGANKQAVAEIQRRHGLNLKAADKRDKFDFINLVNADFIQGSLKLHRTNCAGLIEELGNLIIEERKLPKRVEHPKCPNHLCDSLLYLHRFARQYLSAVPVVPTQSEQFKEEEERFFEQIEQEKYERERENGSDWADFL